MPVTFFEGFRVPAAFEPTPEYAEEFCRTRDALLEDRFTTCSIPCGAEGISCFECLFGITPLNTWRDVARFEACEQYLRENGVLTEQNYTRTPLVYDGINVL